jgi:uncharacterized protein YggE
MEALSNKIWFRNSIIALATIAVVYGLFGAYAMYKAGRGTYLPSFSINVNGEAEVKTIPDVATLTYTVTVEKPTVEDAQAESTKKLNAIKAFLKTQGIEDKDIKTVVYTLDPRYIYPQPAYSYMNTVEVSYADRKLAGYVSTISEEIKIRDTKKAGAILAGVGAAGATQVSGISFVVDNPEAKQLEAKLAAIEDAQMKAEKIAKGMGVKIVRVTGYYENESAYPMYASDMGMSAMSIKTAPELSAGESTIRSQVTVTYEIR